jgi:muramoyltetrapeptide carboxypeptidase
MNRHPTYLKKGDKVAIVCPASKLPKAIDHAIDILTSWGLEVQIGQTVAAEHHQFAGDDDLRTADLQRFLDDPEIKAIISGRGGYGTMRIIDQLDFTAFATNPKWIVGFSDITVLLSHIYAQSGIQCIHGQMPYTFDEATPESLDSLKKALFGEQINYTHLSDPSRSLVNRLGEASGILIGGNLTLLTMVEGSTSEMDYRDKILFIEDVGERPSSIDRMIRMLKRAGKLANLKGLIIGAFNELPQETTPFGQSPEEVIWEVIKDYDYPICFNFPVGHIDDNRALVLGKLCDMSVSKDSVYLRLI